MARREIVFDDGTPAVVYKETDIRSPITFKQARDLVRAVNYVPVPETKELLLIVGTPKQKREKLWVGL